jgi:hypothetical protein
VKLTANFGFNGLARLQSRQSKFMLFVTQSNNQRSYDSFVAPQGNVKRMGSGRSSPSMGELDLPVTTKLSSPVEPSARFGVELAQ